jgi:hypothetical protein
VGRTGCPAHLSRAASSPTCPDRAAHQQPANVCRSHLVTRLGAVVAAVAVEVIVAVACAFLLGFGWIWAVLLALPIAAVVLVWRSTSVGIDPSWQPLPDTPTPAAYLEAATLAERLGDAAVDQGRFVDRVQPRLARLVVARLRRHPATADLVDLTDPRAAELLGPQLHELVTDPRATLPAPAVLAALLDRLENL